MRCYDLIFDTLIVELKCVLGTVTFEYIQVFNCKLLILVPSYPQALVLSRLGSLFLKQCCIQ